MIRRRRPVREIAFSFDSFLDVVANVVGIIIKLILVVWVGARSYSSLTVAQRTARPTPGHAREEKPITDPLQQELARHREELAAAQARLLKQLRQVQQIKGLEGVVEGELQTVAARAREQEQAKDRAKKEELQRQAEARARARTAALSLDELRRKSDRLREALRELEKQPAPSHTLHYRTPVSQPVNAEEVLFECRGGRVTYIDISTMLDEAGRGMDDKTRQLQTQWEVQDVAGPIGAFRLHYTVARLRGLLDTLPGSGPPTTESRFRYGLTEWRLEPVVADRGESEAAALVAGSQFRQVVDGLDPRQSVVTLWVYPDSFAVYRRLRDYLYDRDIVVAGRPLPEGVPISCSRKGSRSRGQ